MGFRASIAVSTLALWAFVTAAEAGQNATERRREECAFAEKLVTRLKPPTLLKDKPVTFSSLGAAVDAGGEKAVAEWLKRGPGNIFIACPDLRSRLPEGVRFATPQDYEKLSPRREPGPAENVFITGFAAPYVSNDGQYLITGQVYSCNGLCGGAAVSIQRREGAQWGKPQMLMMAIS